MRGSTAVAGAALHPARATPALAAPRAGAPPSPRTEAWRRRQVNLALACSDAALALVTSEAACLAQILWASGRLSGAAVAGIVPVALVWVGLRATQGLYPGFGLDQSEELP